MDRLLLGILNSDKPVSVKKTVVAKIAAASKGAQPPESVASVLRSSLMFVVDGETESMMVLSQPVFVDWASNHQGLFVEFFTEAIASDLLQSRRRRPLGVVWIIDFSLGLIRRNDLATYTRLCHAVARRASCFVSYSIADFELVKSFCSLLLEHRECVPQDDSLHTFVTVLLRAVSRFSIPTEPVAVNHFVVEVPSIIGKLLREIWSCDNDVVANTLQTIFDIVTEQSSTESMSSLGAVIQFIPDILMRSTLQSKACDASLSDETALLALSRMLDMLCWPSTNNIDAWIITFMRGLASVHRYSVLMCIAGSKVDQIFEQLKYPLVQHGFFNVVSYMLLSVQHSPVVFHKVVGSVPELVLSLRQQDTKASGWLLDSLVELIDCLMFQHPGFPDLYEPVVDALKEYAHPSLAVMREKLKQYAWSSVTDTSSVVQQSSILDDVDERRSDTSLTGLCNLGNTCYINSVLQALYMCDSFRRDVLSSVPAASQPAQMSLQQVFAFLSGSQRAAYSPEKFVQESRPSWFMSGVQQDCSEFLRYLLNAVHEQEVNSRRHVSPTSVYSQQAEPKNGALPGLFSQSSDDESRSLPSLVERSFGGLLSMTCHCLQCGTASSRTESFMDLALAIPAESQLAQPLAAVSSSSSSSTHSTPAMVGGSPLVASSNDVQTKSSSSSSSLVESLSLSSLLQRYLMPERLDGDNQYHCDGPCNSLQDGERHVEICAAPTYLIVTLMRFSYNAHNGSHSKIFTDIQYPLILSIPVRSAVPELAADGYHQERYGLVGVIVHSGSSSDAGHYFCYARHTVQSGDMGSVVDSDEDCFTDHWFMFNDSRVTRASFDNIRNLTHKFSRDTAYMLIYRHVDTVDTSASVDITDAFVLDPPLHRYLRDIVDEDNRLYLQEKERRQRSRLSVCSESRLKTFSHQRRNDDDDDDDNVPPGGMNGGFGSFHNGPRAIF